PGEIEQNLLNIAHIKEAVATVVKKNSDSFLAVYYTADEPMQAAHIKEKLSEFLPPYMIPQYFMQLDEIPLTANGKVDRAMLPEPAAVTSGDTRPTGETQTKLAAIWGDILGMSSMDIAGDDDFFLLGGHSLKAAIMAGKIHQAFDVPISLIDIFSSPTIIQLANHIAGASKKTFSAIPPAEKKEYYPLSPAQARQYILHQLAPQSTAYNMPQLIPFDEEKIDDKKLELVFQQLIRRHESFRTSFHQLAGPPTPSHGEGAPSHGEETPPRREEVPSRGEGIPSHEEGYPVQIIHPTAEFQLEYYTINPQQADTPDAGSIFAGDSKNFVRPFDLTSAPLLRVAVITEAGRASMAVDMHHIISDG
ncbi:MAG: hypothetical protein GY765_11130, partial [bacterium]|nr:hypothetical protein [bacterium]